MHDANRILETAFSAHGEGRTAAATAAYRAALTLDPSLPAGWHLYGLLAATPLMIRRALRLNPLLATAWSHLALLEIQAGQATDTARRAVTAALVLAPAQTEACEARGLLAYRANDYRGAIAWLMRAHALTPAKAEPLINLGAVLRDARQFSAAETVYTAAIARKPGSVEAYLGRATTRLVRGHLPEGWEDFEWRWKRYPTPPWNGEDIAGKTILLHAEQGFGDTLQFARYAPLLADRGARVILAVHPALVRLLTRLDPRISVIAQGDPPPPHDVHCPLLSLPRGFATTLDTIPTAAAYLTPDPADSQAAGRHFPRGPGLRIGIVWSGNPAHKNDHNRSLPLSALRSLTIPDGGRLWSLQTGPAAGETPAHWPRLLDGVRDFADTAALVANLDLVITVDTAMAHLAGALGLRCWVLLPYAPDWRWLAIPADAPRNDSPWYPSLRLFRQPRPDDWATPLADVALHLPQLTARQEPPDGSGTGKVH